MSASKKDGYEKIGSIPEYSLKMMEDIIFNNGDYIHNKDTAWGMINKDPYLGKFLINSTPPLGLLFKRSVLNKIEESMPMSEKRKLLESSKVSAKGLVFINSGRISGLRRRIERKAGEVVFTSNCQDGIKHLKGATLNDVAKKLYDILRYNAGQVDTFHAHTDIFSKKCEDKDLVKNLKLHAAVGMNKTKLPKLRDDIKEYTGII